ncbi:MAG: GNAT family N-acetyltransferase [Acidimicrobiia bacterium]|nr:GNAT family N-acetyltransferase [Acidimicrobiia bacterium]MBT8214950.1 GNAT family N-acetyltransferase [Acidimicrobiia bacterium]NNK91455.1 GNAT family N-acetyltransferase [Acidimicrobiia bacterium]
MHEVDYRHRPVLDPDTLNALFAAAWGAPKPDYERVFDHSFTWIGAFDGEALVGFANVAWDGDVHFFLLDTTVHPDHQRRGIGRRLVEEAIQACRGHGEWLHVDGDQDVMDGLYFQAGFESTPAGIIDVS